MALAQSLGRLPNLALARQEDQHVALPQARQVLDGIAIASSRSTSPSSSKRA